MAKSERITRAALRALRPGERLTARGIIAEVLDGGDVRYSVQVMVDGERIARVLGRQSEGVTPTVAERFRESLRTRAREGRLELPKVARQLSASPTPPLATSNCSNKEQARTSIASASTLERT